MKEGVKHSKISKILAEEPYSNFKIKIMKTKMMEDYSTDLQAEAKKLIDKDDTIKNGYNIDIADLKKKIFMAKIAKKNKDKINEE